MSLEKYEILTPEAQAKNKVLKMTTTSVTVKAGTSFELPLRIEKAETIVNWTFKCKGYDIYYGISHAEANGKHNYVIASTSYTPDAEHKGSVTFHKEGEYFLVWDNSYSWLREKNVEYSVEIIRPDLTPHEMVACSKAILKDVAGMKVAAQQYAEDIKTKEKQHQELEGELKVKQEELEKLQNEVKAIEDRVKASQDDITQTEQA